MTTKYEEQFLTIIEGDPCLMHLLRQAATLNLAHWAIAAGTVRSAVWDSLHGYQIKTPPSDVDFIFYDSIRTSPEFEKELDASLAKLVPNMLWESVNQATIHTYTGEAPYTSIIHAVSRWAETATAIGVYINGNGKLAYYAPHGLSDLMELIVRPHLVTPKSREVYLDRIASKEFSRKWPKLRIMMPGE